jgi:hypothetical protein
VKAAAVLTLHGESPPRNKALPVTKPDDVYQTNIRLLFYS